MPLTFIILYSEIHDLCLSFFLFPFFPLEVKLFFFFFVSWQELYKASCFWLNYSKETEQESSHPLAEKKFPPFSCARNEKLRETDSVILQWLQMLSCHAFSQNSYFRYAFYMQRLAGTSRLPHNSSKYFYLTLWILYLFEIKTKINTNYEK